jgi:hypothetical protein
MRWEDMTNLSGAQVTALDAFLDFGTTVRNTAPNQVDSLVPTRTYSNAKAAAAGIADLLAMISLTQQGIQQTMTYYRKKALSDFEAANP